MKKVLSIAVGVIMLLSLIFNGFQYLEIQKLKERHLATFNQEVGFIIQRLEGYEKSGMEEEYDTAISHIYAAYVAVSDYDALMDSDKDLALSYSGYFHRMWNNALFYPEQFKGILDEVLEALRAVKVDHELTDLETRDLFHKWFAL